MFLTQCNTTRAYKPQSVRNLAYRLAGSRLVEGRSAQQTVLTAPLQHASKSSAGPSLAALALLRQNQRHSGESPGKFFTHS
eukprot:990148-Rhodomonas_salina.1